MQKKENRPLEELSALQIYWQLFKNIFVINSCTFGGGFVIIGMIKQTFTEQLHWISEEEVLDMTAIAQSAPGPLGINMAIITGYRIRKIPGALVCTLGAVLPPLIIISVISIFYNQFKDNAVIALALQVMRAGVAAVILDVVINLASNIIKRKNILWILLMVAAFIATVFFNVSAIVLILICAVVGLFDSIRCKRSDESK
ncbi:chromate transporter [Sporofaciens sp. SGI.106]|uniref:chromate transporter n=1 Tax=Sporofaciens sp. SGI.106 TaxID=3420568 RepID=UPI002A980AE8|nr:chromate transporter [Lachnoclostridium sp.]